MIKLARPEGDETTVRRRLWVAEIREGKPASALGVEMGDEGNEYNGSPPSLEARAADGGAGHKPGKGRPSKALRQACEWLRTYLGEDAVYARKLVADGVEAGHAERTIFRALKEVGAVRGGTKGNVFYRLPRPGEDVVESDDDDSETETDE